MQEIKHRIDLMDLLDELGLSHLPTAEIGVAEGGFSFEILSCGSVKHYLVDNWGCIEGVTGDGNFCQEWHDRNFLTAKQRNSIFDDRAVFLKGLSVEMAKQVPDNSLGFVYLDGAHYYDGVMADLTAWLPKLAKGGIMAGHDYLNTAYGVKQAVTDFCKNKFDVHLIPETRKDDAGFYFIKK